MAVRFLIVGGIPTVVTIGLFNLLVHGGARPPLGTHPVTGYALAMLAALALNYAGNRFWSFDTGHRGNLDRAVPWSQATQELGDGLSRRPRAETSCSGATGRAGGAERTVPR
jgi:putative flippase GtrA